MISIDNLYYSNKKLLVDFKYTNCTDLKWKFSYPRGNTFRPLKVDFNFMVNNKFFEGIYPQDIFENKDNNFITLDQGEHFTINLDLESWVKTMKSLITKLSNVDRSKIWVCVSFSFNTDKFGEIYTDYKMCEIKVKDL